MAPLLRVKARWSGFQGAPGYSVFHFRDFSSETFTPADATASVNAVRAFFLAVANVLPPVVSVDVQTDVEMLNVANGDLIDVLTASPVATVTGGASGTVGYASPVGGVVTWRTNVVRKSRRIRGRTFVVPLSSAAFENNGTLSTGALTSFGTAAAGLKNATGGPDFGIWARPTKAEPDNGEFAPVTGYSVPDMGAVLRSRRD